MANDNNIKKFTAPDIEKYHEGLLSSREMNEMEKAALDDPFLADAMEGYAVPGVNATADIAELKKKLAEKTEQAKVVPMNDSRKAFPWFRAAAAVVIIAGAAVLANQFLFNKKSNDIAQANAPLNKDVLKTIDTTKGLSQVTDTPIQNAKPGTTVPASNSFSLTTGSTSATTENGKRNVPAGNAGTQNDDNSLVQQKVQDNVVPPVVTGSTVSTPPATGAGNDRTDMIVSTEKVADKEFKNADTKKLARNNNAVNTDTERGIEIGRQESNWYKKDEKAVASNRKTEEQNYRNQTANVFRGRVTDASNIGVPFANVTNVEDNAGTYTDAKGNFILTSPDTVLNVQVRSIGFENNVTQLRNAAPTNQVVLQDDRRSLSEVVVSNQKPNTAARSRDANKTLEEPEPADGWDNYDAYLVNNLNVPEDVKSKQNNSGSVQVSFEVDNNGDPTNIKVEKSLCSKCDKEAIRLIKDGPKWKRNASKKGRTTVTINF